MEIVSPDATAEDDDDNDYDGDNDQEDDQANNEDEHDKATPMNPPRSRMPTNENSPGTSPAAALILCLGRCPRTGANCSDSWLAPFINNKQRISKYRAGLVN